MNDREEGRSTKPDQRFEEGQSRFVQRGRERRKTHYLKDLTLRFMALAMVILLVTVTVMAFIMASLSHNIDALSAQMKSRNRDIATVKSAADRTGAVITNIDRIVTAFETATKNGKAVDPVELSKVFAAVYATRADVGAIRQEVEALGR